LKILINRRGFNLIEVIIGIVILSIIASSLALLFSLNLDLPYIQNRTKVYTYAQNEMEKLNNKSFSEIVGISKTVYPEDLNYDYEIIVYVGNEETKKEVTINFYPKGKNDKVAELFSEFILLTTKICDDFEINKEETPPWNWKTHPSGQWSVVNFDGSNRLSYERKQEGYAYPDWIGSSNYSLKGRIYLTDPGLLLSSYIYIGGRYNSRSGYGYFIKIESFDLLILGITYVNLVKVTSSGETNLLSETFLYDIFDQWINVELRMDGNTISYYFNDTLLGSIIDSEFTSGNIYLEASCGRNNRNIYFDDICVEEIQ